MPCVAPCMMHRVVTAATHKPHQAGIHQMLAALPYWQSATGQVALVYTALQSSAKKDQSPCAPRTPTTFFARFLVQSLCTREQLSHHAASYTLVKQTELRLPCAILAAAMLHVPQRQPDHALSNKPAIVMPHQQPSCCKLSAVRRVNPKKRIAHVQ
jgi:hypothetical protein